MANNALAYVMQMGIDAKDDVVDAVAGMSNKELLIAGSVIGLGIMFAPHLLALNGGLSILGSFGRAGTVQTSTDGKSATVNGEQHDLSGYEVEF